MTHVLNNTLALVAAFIMSAAMFVPTVDTAPAQMALTAIA